MTAKDLKRIEDELAIELPTAYRKFVLRYPKALLELKRTFGKHSEGPADRELLNDPDALIELNEMIQSSDNMDDFPPEYFLIGDDGCGNYYVLDTDEENSPVYFWNHERSDFDAFEEKESIHVFAADLLAPVEGLDEVAKKPKKKKSP